jgi:hypothetical protein
MQRLRCLLHRPANGNAPEVVDASANATKKQPAPPFLGTDQQTPASDREIRSCRVRLPRHPKAKPTPITHSRQALNFNKKSDRVTGRRARRPECHESEWQMLAEAAVDLSEILLGDGIHKINPLEDRMKLAIKKAESIRKVVDHGDYDRLLHELPANTLPKITPSAFLRWLDGEFKDVIDAVFFVDSAEEFAKLLQSFAQEIADNFFGDKVRVNVKVNSARRGKKAATSNNELATVAADPATLATGASGLSAHPDRLVL